MMTKEQKKGRAKQVRIREDKAERVEKVAIKATGARGVRLEAIDIYDEILEGALPELEKKYGV